MNLIRILFRIFCASLIVAAFFQIFFTQKSFGANEIVQALEEREQELSNKEKILHETEQNLAERERDIEAKLKELNALRNILDSEFDNKKSESEERIKKMVVVFEGMSPKAAANVFDVLDDWLSVEILKKMDPKKMSKIMAQLDKSRSARLSELLTGYYHASQERKLSSFEKMAGQAAAVSSLPNSGASTKPDATRVQSPTTNSSNLKKGGANH